MRELGRFHLPLLAMSAILTLVSIYLAVIHAPPHEDMGDVQRIFYFHVATAWISYVAFAVTIIASLVYLRTRDLDWDAWALSSAEIGVMFCTLAIVTGALWAKSVWGVYWRWEDMKLLMTLVLLLVFIAYLALRANVDSRRRRAELGAVFSVLGLVCIPLSFTANRIWTQYHPTIIATSGSAGSLQPTMVVVLVVAVVAFTFLYVTMLLMRLELESLRDELEEKKQKVGDENA